MSGPSGGARGGSDRTTERRVTLNLSRAEIELVREDAESRIESFEYRGQQDHKQPTEWHEGQTMLALAKKLAAAFRAARAS